MISGKIIEHKHVAKGHFLLRIAAQSVSEIACSGQFVVIRCGFGIDPLLSRPFSLCEIEKEWFSILYKVVGRGTAWLSQRVPGEKLYLRGPFGKELVIPSHLDRIALLGGGVGIAPLIAIGKQLLKEGRKIYCLFGFKDKDTSLAEQFRYLFKPETLIIATEDGSIGEQGTAVKALEVLLNSKNIEFVIGCGPRPMLIALAELLQRHSIKAVVSVEEYIACATGVCKGCVVELRKNDSLDTEYKKVCKDGPFFELNSIVFR